MKDDYKIGFRKPPEATRFKKGKSGNPKGRPTRTSNLKTDLLEELQEPVLVREGSLQKEISKQRAMLKGLMARATQGDARAANLILSLIFRFLEVNISEDDEELSPNEQAILAEFESDVARKIQNQNRANRTGKPKKKINRNKNTTSKKIRRK